MCHYHGYQGRRVAIELESPKHDWLLHQGAAATTIDLAIDLAMSAKSQTHPLPHNLVLTFQNPLPWLGSPSLSSMPVSVPTSAPTPRIKPTHPQTVHAWPRPSSTQIISTATSFADSVAVNALYISRDLIHFSTERVRQWRCCFCGGGSGRPRRAADHRKGGKLAQETTGIDKDTYAKKTQGGFKEHADA